ncbi:MAG: hypothetical protein M1823_003010 [Watsoniomyces obsoletus]|nr:MAG: hypothetical protein M1823_003010 [Watsoniomyces obsoletus]
MGRPPKNNAPTQAGRVSTGSEPMKPSTSTSSSSDPSKQENPNMPGPSVASPYGTRSRNRVGGSRPNYAEQDVEMDYEMTGPAVTDPTQHAPKPPPRSAEKRASMVQAPERAVAGVSTRRSSAAIDQATVNASGPARTTMTVKEQIPGTLTFSAKPPTTAGPPTKKRKSNVGEKAIPTATGHTSEAKATPPARKVSTALAATSSVVLYSNMPTFEQSQRHLKQGKLKADDGSSFRVNDHVYLVCEPPGEPYYLARIMEFIHVDNKKDLPVESVRVNWYYRPRDIQRKATDTRNVFATMHSDVCPLTSLRGKCQIMHRSEITNLDEYRKTRDSFWFDRLFDRYISRYYDVIPVSQVINVPAHVKKVLDERWRYLIVETGRGKELTSAVKTCKRCAGYCASNDSVDCAVCRSTYHMGCVRPPLLKKPSRGFAWACGPCSRAQERKLEARNTPLINGGVLGADEDEIMEEDDDEGLDRGTQPGGDAPGVGEGEAGGSEPRVDAATPKQSAHAKLWPWRYLGQHCRVEDALDYDDRIYPRASSRLGPRHQAPVGAWPGRPVELVKATEIKRKYARGAVAKKDAKLSKDTLAALEAEKLAKEKRPIWVQDEPSGYVARGEDYESDDPRCTATLMFKMRVTDHPEKDAITERFIERYVDKIENLADDLGVDPSSTNLLDKAVEILYRSNFNMFKAIPEVQGLDKEKDLKEPNFTKEEQRLFEEGVAKFGSELHSVSRHVKTQKHANIVRYYYVWKKTPRGRQIWGQYEGRKGKKEVKEAIKKVDGAKLLDDFADDGDDSAFDEAKATRRKRSFECKFCGSKSSQQWRRAPGAAAGATYHGDRGTKGNTKDKGSQTLVALCRRCGELWRRYGIQWEDLDEVAKKLAQGGGKAWKRKIDEELLRELASDIATPAPPTVVATTSNPVQLGSVAAVAPPVASVTPQPTQEPAKKKLKLMPPEKESSQPTTQPKTNTKTTTTAPHKPQERPKKKAVEKVVPPPPPPPPPPEPPKPKILPCAVCSLLEPIGEQHIICRECRMTVHRNCYGVLDGQWTTNNWICDMCANDKNPQVATAYECVLCPVRYTHHEFVDEPKVTTGRKKSQKEREKEREKEEADRESTVAVADLFRKKQEEMNRPTNPREPLKRTLGNNWVHVNCAVWIPEIKFGNAKALEPSEGLGAIPSTRYMQSCKICKQSQGACVTCHHCHAPVHVTCAQQAGYTLGFDITPVKSSRRDLVNTVTLGEETGVMVAAVWCKEHSIKTIVHPMHEKGEDPDLNALQIFVRNYKQADLTLTGTVRKANLISQSTKVLSHGHGVAGHRRTSTSGGASTGTHRPASMNGVQPDRMENGETQPDEGSTAAPLPEKKCVTCNANVSPRWWECMHVKRTADCSDWVINGHVPGCTCAAENPEPVLLLSQTGIPYNKHLDGCPVERRRPAINKELQGVFLSPESGVALEQVARKDDLYAGCFYGDEPSQRIITPYFQCHKCHCKTLNDASILAGREVPGWTRRQVPPARPATIPNAALPLVSSSEAVGSPPGPVRSRSRSRSPISAPRTQTPIAENSNRHAHNGPVSAPPQTNGTTSEIPEPLGLGLSSRRHSPRVRNSINLNDLSIPPFRSIQRSDHPDRPGSMSASGSGLLLTRQLNGDPQPQIQPYGRGPMDTALSSSNQNQSQILPRMPPMTGNGTGTAVGPTTYLDSLSLERRYPTPANYPDLPPLPPPRRLSSVATGQSHPLEARLGMGMSMQQDQAHAQSQRQPSTPTPRTSISGPAGNNHLNNNNNNNNNNAGRSEREREGRREAGGASASPSLRNLLS